MNIKIDIVSDVACPWCYVGKKRLEKALEAVPEIAVEVTWQPFQLDPTIPKAGIDIQEYYINKFGSEQKVMEIFEHMESVGDAEGILFDFAKMQKTMNSLSLHILMQQAEKEGFKSELKGRFFRAYFEEAIDLSQAQNLVQIMSEYGWDDAKVVSLLSDEEQKEVVKEKIGFFQSRGVSAVPFFIFNDKYGISGAQPVEVLVKTLKNIQMEMQNEAAVINGAESCDVASGEC